VAVRSGPRNSGGESDADYAIWAGKHERAANATIACGSQGALTTIGTGPISPLMKRSLPTIAPERRRCRGTTARLRARA